VCGSRGAGFGGVREGQASGKSLSADSDNINPDNKYQILSKDKQQPKDGDVDHDREAISRTKETVRHPRS
jgi:hypothetical protein